MNPTILQEINVLRDFLEQNNELGIVIGSHLTLDTSASALALYLSLSQAGKKVQIISKKQPTVEVSNLVGIDRVRPSFSGSTGKLVVSLPYVKGEIEKVLFTEAPNTINFHLTASPDKSITPFDVNDVKLTWEGGAPGALITFGVATMDELAGIADNTTKIVNIDNYQGNSRFGDVVLVDESFSSLSEIVSKILKDLQLPLDMDIAQNILDGVLFATRNFTRQNTSPLAFEAASAAMYHGAQRKMEDQHNQSRRDTQSMGQSRQLQNQDRGRGEQRHPQQQARQRVNDNDFPAMHMQNRGGQFSHQENRPTHQQRPQQPQNQPRPQQFGGQQSQKAQADIRDKLIHEQTPAPRFDNNEAIEDAQIVNEPIQNQPIEDMKMPQESSSYSPQSNEDVPDDWLMPKVFKSSKNNN